MFLALQAPQEVREVLVKIQQEVRERMPDSIARWTRPEQFHLTLKFLGDVEVDRAEELESAIRQVTSNVGRFDVTATGIGFFPDAHRPRVLWAGVSNRGAQLANLFHLAQKACEAFTSVPGEKEFVGHITLGRIKKLGRKDRHAPGTIVTVHKDAPLGNWTIESVEIMRSELSAAGAVHETVASIPLGHRTAQRFE